MSRPIVTSIKQTPPPSTSSSSKVDPLSLATELLQAVKNGDASTLTTHCATTPKAVDILINHRDNLGNPAILYAAANGHYEVMKLLLKVNLYT